MSTPDQQSRLRLAAIAGAVALALGLSACGKGETAATGKAASSAAAGEKGEPKKEEAKEGGGLKLSAEEAQRAGVKVETLASLAFADSITVTATIRPNQDRIARVAPRVEGRIISVAVNLGDAVKAGQSLAVLDSLAIGEAQSALQQALSSQRVAQSDFKRAETLSAEEIIPQREFLRAKSELEKASSSLRAAEDRLRLLGASVKSGTGASTFPLSTPLTGTVIQKTAIVGELGTPAAPLFTVADLSRVWIEANLTEDALSKVHVGAQASVKVAAYPSEQFKGRVTYVASLLDKDSRTVPARIEVDNKDGRLKPEMFASATIDTNGAKREALSVPDAAILLLQGQPTIFVAKGEGFESRAIEPGEKLSGRTVIKSGVAAGEKVVTAGAYALKARLLKSQIGDEH
ncbi:Cation efflux system protein CzcB [Methylibium sp. T29-B]|uniref:efflux RND transporter periplasmic adaptor subunit n=1 Tax=Methylibium sp. T29-B TaxID=1437443 RepID=UPI0003F40870|nr:efflux RND transporter periplasmic adaptor subunit [Methylibium sp. T29-B]EWS61988.1 Cation efflux system protein CzcB [Methylibium sp. T29-B]